MRMFDGGEGLLFHQFPPQEESPFDANGALLAAVFRDGESWSVVATLRPIDATKPYDAHRIVRDQLKREGWAAFRDLDVVALREDLRGTLRL